MIYCGITEKDLQKIVNDCQTKPFYKVIIACKDNEKLKYCKDILKQLLPRFNTAINPSWYNFSNHSSLLLSKSIYLRGHRCNDLYYNLMEDEEIIELILRPCANLPYNEEIVTKMIEYYKNKGEKFMNKFLERHFHIKERDSTISREVIGGLVTFMAMAYIIFVNPSILGVTGMDYTALTLATCISAAIGTLLTAFMANVPFAQAPGLGINALFSYTLCLKLGYTWQQCLGMTFISGLIFLFITLSPLRNKIIEAIPMQLKRAISVGIGLFITLIGLINAGIVTANNNLLDLGNLTSGAPLLGIIGLALTAILLVFKVRGAILYSIIATTLIGIPLGVTNTNIVFNFSSLSLAPTFFKLTFIGLTTLGLLPVVTSILTLCMCDCFDTVGTLTGCAAGCDMLDENGNIKSQDMTKALTADAIATCTGSLLGTSTVTTFVESSTGVAAGARTGFASVITGLLFLLACLFAPIAGIVPSAATAPALIIVGIFMMKNVTNIDWTNMEVAIPCFLTIAMMPFAYSISDGIGFGLISWTLLKIIRGKFKEIPVLMYILSALFIIMYIVA